MFGLLTRSRKRPAARATPSRARLSVEELETRFCPAAPSVTLQVADVGGGMLRLYGLVTDENPTSALVEFSGVVSGTGLVDVDGTFSVDLSATGFGTITATATDEEGLTGTDQENFSSANPTILDFTASQGHGGVWTFSGRVVDEYAPGMTVYFGGIASLDGRTTTVQADGTFSLTVTLQPGETGTADCQVYDWWNLASNLATCFVQNLATESASAPPPP